MSYLQTLAGRLKAAKPDIASAGTDFKNQILMRIAVGLEENSDEILQANGADIKRAMHEGASSAMLDRLSLTHERIVSIANGVRKVVSLNDPIGELVEGKRLPNGLSLQKVRVPLGIVGMIYEARPNVTVDAAVLCIKSSNAVLLKGGKEALNTNMALVKVMQREIAKLNVNPDMVLLVEDISRETTMEMMRMNDTLNVLIPRGGAGLIRSVVENATVPVIETGSGNCHVYVDADADFSMAADIVYNAKTSRPSVCNACESLLVHHDAAREFLPMVKKQLDQKGVIMLGCPTTRRILGESIELAADADYAAEFLDYVISVKVVDSLEDAVRHIDRYSTGHSETIVTENLQNAMKFTREVDSAAVYVNASTRFTDGEEFGLGAEIGISTQKLHARGPMGLTALTSTKYIIFGSGQTR